MIMRFFSVVCLAALLVVSAFGNGRTATRDGSHDFDWDIGTWATHQRRLLHPLTNSSTWVEYSGTDVVRKLWDGGLSAAIEADGPSGHFEVFSVRLYNADTHQWLIYFTNPSAGTFGQPVYGEFEGTRADFIDQEPYKGRMILVRFDLTSFTKDTCSFQQAFSSDGGKTWEVNFIVNETRIPTKQ